MEIDWMQCELVESVEGRCGGQPTVVGTRVFPEGILFCHDEGLTAEFIHEECYPSVSRDQIKRLIEFAESRRHREAA